MFKRIIDKIEYLKRIKLLNDASRKFCLGHQVKLFNWSKPFEQDMWLIDFIEKRNLLNGNKKKKVALYSVFGPRWVTWFDNADVRLFVERENLHKPQFEGFLHRYLEDEKFSLSLGFDDIQHPQYMRFPFWLMWTVFPSKAECSSIALCEANAFGLPCFVYDTGGTANYVSNDYNGYMLPLSSCGNDFAIKIIESINTGRLKEMSNNARNKYKSCLNWEAWSEKVGALINKL